MKMIILILGMFFLPLLSSAQYKMYVSQDTATTSWDSVGFANVKVLTFEVSNDAASGTDTLFVAVKNDTGRANIYPLLAGEVKKFFIQTHFIRTKASANTIPRRVEGE